MLVGIPSREPSASSMLAWDDVSTGGTVTSNFWGGDMVATASVIFSREDCSDSQLDLGVWFSIGGNVDLQVGMFAGNDAHTAA